MFFVRVRLFVVSCVFCRAGGVVRFSFLTVLTRTIFVFKVFRAAGDWFGGYRLIDLVL